jgi:ABC-type multidrug transport system ATPase subunit
MRGQLHIATSAGSAESALPRTPCILGESADGTPALFHARDAHQIKPLLSFHWDARKAAWSVTNAQPEFLQASLNGRPIRGQEPVFLRDLDLVEFPGVYLQFQRLLEEPFMAGASVNEIPLTAETLVFGSARENTPDPRRVNLDADDLNISRVHATITREGRDYFIEDQSSLGTELNGVAFKREKLVFGDRFRISDYIFEFTGSEIRRVRPEFSGWVSARNLSKTAGTRRILEDVSLNITAGEFVGVLGRSGQGKSTFLTALCGISPFTEGEAKIGGIDLTDREGLREIGIGYVPQDDIVHRELTVLEAVTFSARLRLNLQEHLIGDLVGRVIGQLGLKPHENKRIALLSGGQRKRVSIAIELLAKPSILFLDEPSSGLDPATEAELMTLLQSLTWTKLTVVCTTHVLHKAYLFDRILVVEGGRLIFAGNVDEARQYFLAKEESGPDAALEKTPLEKIFSLLHQNDLERGRSALEWAQKYSGSIFGKRAFPPIREKPAAFPKSPIQRHRVGAWRTLSVLALRQWAILKSDRLNLAFLAAQPLLIGFFIGWATRESALRMFLCVVATMWFGCSNGAQQIVSELPIFRRERVCGQGLNPYIFSKAAFLSVISVIQAVMLLFSTQSAARCFQAEKNEFEDVLKDIQKRLTPPDAREENAPADQTGFDAVGGEDPGKNQPAGPAPSQAATAKPAPEPPQPSPLLVHAVATTCEFFQITQNVLDSGPRVVSTSDGNPVRDAAGREILSPGLSVWGVLFTTLALRFAAIAGAALVSVGIGLAISSLVANTTQAVLWVPLVLIPQILFGGIVVPVPEMSRSVRYFSRLMPSSSAQRIADVSAIFGMDTPAIANRTKTPVFLSSSGEKDSISWDDHGENRTQDYDKVSQVNTAWQNLTVWVDHVGEHKWEKVAGAEGEAVYPDSVQKRHDVTLQKGMPYLDLTPFRESALLLLIWALACYATLLAGLKSKETGR